MKELTFFIAGFLLAKYLSKGKTITLIDNSNGYQNNRGNYKTIIVSDKPITANEIKNVNCFILFVGYYHVATCFYVIIFTCALLFNFQPHWLFVCVKSIKI